MTPNSRIPMGQWSGSDAVDQLRKTIVELDRTTTGRTNRLLRLTWLLVALTGLLVILTVVIVVLTFMLIGDA